MNSLQAEVRFTFLDTRNFMFEEDLDKNEVEWIGKVEIRKKEVPAVCKTLKAIFWPTPHLNELEFGF